MMWLQWEDRINMDFGKQIKKIKKENHLTQEDMAKELQVSRQAISNWENNKNLPDISLIIRISQLYSVTLDELLLGSDAMNNMTEKSMQDASDIRRTQLHMVILGIGTLLLILGFVCFLLKVITVEYIDVNGMIHENFFLLPIGFAFIFCGLMTFVIAGFNAILKKSQDI